LTDADIASQDARQRRCPMLGHDVTFAYCRAPGPGLPCRRIFDCWWETFDVVAFIGRHFSEADIEAIRAPRADKAGTIVELIRRAQQRQADPAPDGHQGDQDDTADG